MDFKISDNLIGSSPEQFDLDVDGPAGDVDEPLARHNAPEDVDPEGGRRVAYVRVRVERYPVLEVDVAGAGEEGDAVAVAQREVAVAAGEICFDGW